MGLNASAQTTTLQQYLRTPDANGQLSNQYEALQSQRNYYNLLGNVGRDPSSISPLIYQQSGNNSARYLGQYSTNPYNSESTSNPYGEYGSPYSSKSINNPYGEYGSAYSSTGVNNPFATATPKLYGQDGQYLGKLSSNPYDAESTSNPYGTYGSSSSPTSINNPFGQYGSPYSNLSARNPFATQAPIIVDDQD